jgi:crotonobetainyl-CoA:carnitine CoA-transferase CaiB-like acyl-CoA transferase
VINGATMAAAGRRPFEGIRVLDLSRVLAGPYCAQLLSDFGADVIKVEEPKGDEIRHWFPRTPDGDSTNFQSVNRGKRSISLDLKNGAGRAVLLDLVRSADVLLHSFLPSSAERLGVDFATLSTINPRLIHCSVSGYGATGAMRDAPGYDLMMQAFSGMMMLTGEPSQPPTRLGISAIDMATGMLAFGGISSALYARDVQGAGGQAVELSLLETAVALLGYHVTNFVNADFMGERAGSGVGHIVPYQAFRCADGWILAGAPNDALFGRFLEALDASELAADARFVSTTARRQHKAELIALLEPLFLKRSMAEWTDRFSILRVPCSPVHTLDQTLAHPQVAERDMVRTMPDGTKLVGVPVKLSGTPGAITTGLPRLAADRDDILEGLGYDESQVAHAASAGAFG